MHSEDGFASLHYVIVAVFALTVALGAFAGTMAMESMTEAEMSEVEGQEGIAMDLRLGSSFQIDEARYTDADGWSGAATPTSGAIGFHQILPSGDLALNGITIDADASAQAEGAANAGAIVIGLPQIPSGIKVGGITPGSATTSSFNATPTNESIGGFAVGGINMTGANLVISAN
jgi:hypothetical protein